MPLMAGLVENECLKILRRKRFRVVLVVLAALLCLVVFAQYRQQQNQRKDHPERDWRAQVDSAVRLARRSEVAVVVAGVEEGEFRDRAFLGLPGHQEALIREVAATGTPVVVVIVGGSAVTMPWLEQVDGVLDVWYPGEVGGQAVADVLFGDVDPGGRLPVTFPIAEGQLPLVYDHKPTGRGDDYLDLTGQPLFPFGFGIGYTSFEYSALRISPASIVPPTSTTIGASSSAARRRSSRDES